MKRFLWVALTSLVLTIVGAQPSFAQVNNFRISSYDIAYELLRNEDGRSQLNVTEKITAVFPQTNQNRGIERAIPSLYDNHPLGVKVSSVTDENGNALEYTERLSSDMKVLRIGDPDVYVHGEHTYVITYRLHDVTKLYEDTGRHEWYWDTNGNGWRVPIDALTIKVVIDPSLLPARVDAPRCYVGVEGATGTCELTESTDGVYTTSAGDLSAGENITVAFGFEPGTFEAYQASLSERLYRLWWAAQLFVAPFAVGTFIFLLSRYHKKHMRTSELKPFPVQYIPPHESSLLVGSRVVPEKIKSVFSAQLIDLAVRHYISLIETREKSLWRTAEYDIKIEKDISPLFAEEKEILIDMFGHEPKPGERLALKSLRNNFAYVTRTSDNTRKLSDLITSQYEMYAKSPEATKYFYTRAKLLLAIGVVLLSPFVLFLALAASTMGWVIKPLSDKGLTLRRYLYGLDRYINSTEKERLAFLQGPDTAEKVGFAVDPNDKGQLVKLYERTLPYAVLFGQEKKWTKQLGEFYSEAGTQPDWYAGKSGVFNAAAFSSGVSAFSQASAYSSGYTAGSSSSSSGGSNGGGFSGGGGGGGGGGGW